MSTKGKILLPGKGPEKVKADRRNNDHIANRVPISIGPGTIDMLI